MSPSYDPMALRRGKRTGAQRGLWVYIPAEELRKTTLRASELPPLYRTAAREGGRTVVVQLFRRER